MFESLFAPLTPAGLDFQKQGWDLFLANHFTPEFPIFWIGAVTIALLLIKLSPYSESIAEWNPPAQLKRWFAPAVGGFLTLLVVFNFQVQLGGRPHVVDNIAYWSHARFIAHGFFNGVPIPPGTKDSLVRGYLVETGGRLISKYPPGYPFLLAPFTLLGTPTPYLILVLWLNLFLLNALARRVGLSEGERLIFFALLATSPFFIFISSSLYSQGVGLAIVLAIELGLLEGRFRWVAVLLAALYLIRPLDGALMVFFAWVSVVFVLPNRLATRDLLAGVLLFALGPFLMGIYNQNVTGDFLTSTYSLYSPYIRPGFGPGVGMEVPYGHNLLNSVNNLCLNFAVLTEDLFGWPLLSLVPLLFFGWNCRRWIFQNHSPAILMQIMLIGTFILGYGGYFHHGVSIGARFYFPCFGALVLLSVVGLRAIPKPFVWGIIPLMAISLIFNIADRSLTLRDFEFILTDPFGRAPPPDFDRHILVVPEVKIGHRDLFDSFILFNEPWRGRLNVVTVKSYRELAARGEKRLPIKLNFKN